MELEEGSSLHLLSICSHLEHIADRAVWSISGARQKQMFNFIQFLVIILRLPSPA
jgi:hypothetical protein